MPVVLIAEKLLLVAVDDKGHVPGGSDAFVKVALTGALLAELAIGGHLTIGNDGTVRTGDTRPGDELLAEVYDAVSDHLEGRKARQVISGLSRHIGGSRDRVVDRLADGRARPGPAIGPAADPASGPGHRGAAAPAARPAGQPGAGQIRAGPRPGAGIGAGQGRGNVVARLVTLGRDQAAGLAVHRGHGQRREQGDSADPDQRERGEQPPSQRPQRPRTRPAPDYQATLPGISR